MTRLEPFRFGLFLCCLLAALATLSLAKGGLYLSRHEGDTLHLIEILWRMNLGQIPHIDFMTPLGIAGFLPMAAFLNAGFGVGYAILLGQILAALLVLPFVYYIARSRFDGWMAYAFGAIVIVMVVALVHGESADNVSVSMHYNRWSWALVFLAVPAAIFPPKRGGAEWLDGVLIGLSMSFFILGKVTFAVAFAPLLLAALALRQAWSAMVFGGATVILCALLPVFAIGIEFWPAYITDLRQVAASEIRPRPGADWASLLLAPAYLLGNAILVACIVLLRKGPNPSYGALLMLFAPACFYVTYQNYGNDPKWLLLLAFLMLKFGQDVRYRSLALAAAVLIAPSFLNMVVSPYRHLLTKTGGYIATFTTAPHTDIYTLDQRMNRVLERRSIHFPEPQFAELNAFAQKEDDVILFEVAHPLCVQNLGLLGSLRNIAADLRAFGLGQDAKIFTADTFSNLWMFGPFAPLPGGAPWYYGDLSGFKAADYVLIPNCPVAPRAFREIAQDINALENIEFQQLRATSLYSLYRVIR